MKFHLRKPIPWSKIMKITISQFLIAITLSCMAYARPVIAQGVLDQQVSISLTKTTLYDVMHYLTEKNRIKFIYSKSAVDLSRIVSVNVRNEPLKNVLEKLFSGSGIGYDVFRERIILNRLEKNTNGEASFTPISDLGIDSRKDGIPVSGKVVDASGAALPGVNVIEKGTTNGTSTSADGSFNLSVANQSAVLVVNFIGFNEQQITVGSRSTFSIVLKTDVKGLADVVVVGYGTQSKKLVTGAISSVKATDLQDQQVTRIEDALQGRTSGVTVVQNSGAPGSQPLIRIRGTTSINNSDPLYVIDGVIVDNGGLDNINPNDIESIDVLKDASAAIYGSRSSNGVVIVTTKKGKLGPPRITYSGYVGFQGPVSKVKLANASQYATLRNESVTNDGGTAPFSNPSQFGTGTNWQNQIFSNSALIQNHNLNLSGATEKVSYYTSFAYFDQQGIVMPKISDYKRFNFSINTSYKVKKWITIGENLAYTYVNSRNSQNTNSVFGGPLSSALNLDPITPVIVTNPSTQPNAGEYTGQPYAVRNNLGQYFGISNYVHQELTNPLAYVQTQLGNYGFGSNLLGSAFVEITPIAGLKLRSQYSAKQAFYGGDSFTPLYYLNSSTSNISNTSQYESLNRNLTWNLDNTATYTRAVGKHNFSVLIGTSAQKESGMGLGGTFIGEPVNTLGQASPNFTLSNANKIANGFDNQPYRTSSVFGRVTYDYDQKYLFSGVIRHDGSSKFGSNNVYGTFPSAELGYIVSKEDFLDGNPVLTFLKIRGSYGVVGNEMSLGTFQYISTIASGHNAIFGNDNLIIGYSPNAPSNPNLKWETTHTADIGLDATLMNNLNVTFDLYQKKTFGMLEGVQLPSYAGFAGEPSANIGNMENKGAELELGFKSNRTARFKYTLNGNISYNHNQVTSLGTQIQYQTVGSVQSANYEIGRTTVGQPVGAFYGFQELGVFHSQPDIDNYKTASGTVIQPNAKPGDFKWADVNGDGKIDASDRKFLGNPLPTFVYGLNLTASYGNFDIRLFGQGAWGNKIFQGYRRLDIPAANYPIEALNAWTPNNPNSNYARLSDNDPNNNYKNPSNFYLQNGAYFRLKTLQVGYTLPASWMKKADIQRCRIFVSSTNLFTITQYKGFDPEIQGGIDMGIYPQSRMFIVGLDVTL